MEPPNGSPIFFRLNLHQPSLSPISRWPYCEVNPDDATLLLYQQFVEVLAAQVCDVEQYRCIAQCLLNPRHPDVEDVHHTRGLVILFVLKYKENREIPNLFSCFLLSYGKSTSITACLSPK